MVRYWAFIFLSPNFDPKKHVTMMESDECKCKMIGIDFKNKAQVVEIAKDLVKEGVQVIELCGGFGPEWIAKISEALEYKIPIGGVFYGPECRKPMLEIMS